LVWSNVNYQVNIATPTPFVAKLKRIDARSQTTSKKILTDVSGSCMPGQLLAILGSSGAGKTSILNVLAGRIMGSEVSGSILLNGKKITHKVGRKVAFVRQEDLFYKTLTVREHLTFQAKMRMGDITEQERQTRITQVLKDLGLVKIENSLIGQVGLGGISGGERRRLSFANEILTNPPLLFVDEPTSGLDSFMAENVVQVLRRLARAGRTIVCTIHQPSSEVFMMFDRVMLMAEGRVGFFGTVEKALEYFSLLGFVCPPYSNPADFFIKQLSIVPEKREESLAAVHRFLDTWHNSPQRRDIVEENAKETESEEDKKEKQSTQTSSSWCTQFMTLCNRSWLTTSRDVTLTKARLGQAIILSVICGLIYLRTAADNNQKSIQNITGVLFFMIVNQAMGGVMAVLQTFPVELPMFYREYQARMYTSSSFYLARTLSEAPFQIGFPIIFATICYWMIGLDPTAERYFGCVFVIVLTANVAFSLGYMISTLASTVQVALALGPVILLPFMLFGGFFINEDSIPVYFSWIAKISFFKYGYEAVSINEWKDKTIGCDPGEVCQTTSGNIVLQTLSMDPNDYWRDVGVLFGLLAGFRFISFLFLYRRSRRREISTP